MASIIIPAHDEAEIVGRLIKKLLKTMRPGEFEIIVVANGCHDDTATRAAAIDPAIRVISLPVPSKHQALVAGNQAASRFPRLYVDADVELGTEDVRALVRALDEPGLMCAGPLRIHDMTGSPWQVRWWYSIWMQLPEVRKGFFGRGVIGVSAAGYARLLKMPPLMADDLAASLAFLSHERLVVAEARVLIHPPRTFADLLRSRTRAAMGSDQLESTSTAVTASARTRLSDVMKIVMRAPHRAPQAALFLAVAVAARRRARTLAAERGYTTWLRDESSRTVSMPATACSGDREYEQSLRN
jgi:glycosyltransferase involved in cell wall biosynthesis